MIFRYLVDSKNSMPLHNFRNFELNIRICTLYMYYINIFVYQKALILTFHTSFLTKNSLCEMITPDHKFKG